MAPVKQLLPGSSQKQFSVINLAKVNLVSIVTLAGSSTELRIQTTQNWTPLLMVASRIFEDSGMIVYTVLSEARDGELCISMKRVPYHMLVIMPFLNFLKKVLKLLHL